MSAIDILNTLVPYAVVFTVGWLAGRNTATASSGDPLVTRARFNTPPAQP
jgi:hypothetical protein